MAGPLTTLTTLLRRRDDGSSRRPRRPLGPMLREEAAHAVAQVAKPATLVAALVAGATVFVVLGPATPGPVVPNAWLPILASLLALLAAVFAHLLLTRTARSGRQGDVVAAIAAVALVVAGTVVVATLLDLLTSTFPDRTGSISLDASLDVDPFIAVAGVLLAIAVVASAVGRRMGLPTSLLFLAIGVLAGPDGFGWVQVGSGTVRNMAIVALVVILFDGGATTSLADLRRAAAPGAVLATIGVMATAAITAGIVLLVLPGAGPRTAWLVGAVVASTDAAALANMLRGIKLPHRVESLLRIESGGNDPIAVMLTIGILASWDAPIGPGAWVSFALWQLVGGLLTGIVVGAIGGRVIERLDLPGVSLYPVLALALAGVAYGTAAVLGASGLLAAYVAGVVLAASSPRHRRGVQRFTAGVSSVVEVGLFLLLGLQVQRAGLLDVAIPGIVIALGLILVARPIAVVVSLAGFRLPRREVAVVSWLGIRGAVPIVLATYATTAGIDGARTILDLVFFVVAASLLLHGLTAQAVADRADLAAADAAEPVEVELLVGDLEGAELYEATVTGSSSVVDVRLADRPPDRGMRVLLVTRATFTFPPDGDTVLRRGDRLVVSSTDREAGVAGVVEWLGQPDHDTR